jgi:PAS domain-containing protein
LFESLIHPEDRKPYQDALEPNIQHELGKPFVYRIIRPDNGQIVQLQANGRRIESEDGDVRFIGSVLDITDRVLAQQEREAQTVQRDPLLSTAKIGIWYWTVGSNKLIWDVGCSKIFDEFLPDLKAVRYHDIIHTDDRDYVKERLVEG